MILSPLQTKTPRLSTHSSANDLEAQLPKTPPSSPKTPPESPKAFALTGTQALSLPRGLLHGLATPDAQPKVASGLAPDEPLPVPPEIAPAVQGRGHRTGNEAAAWCCISLVCGVLGAGAGFGLAYAEASKCSHNACMFGEQNPHETAKWLFAGGWAAGPVVGFVAGFLAPTAIMIAAAIGN